MKRMNKAMSKPFPLATALTLYRQGFTTKMIAARLNTTAVNLHGALARHGVSLLDLRAAAGVWSLREVEQRLGTHWEIVRRFVSEGWLVTTTPKA